LRKFLGTDDLRELLEGCNAVAVCIAEGSEKDLQYMIETLKIDLTFSIVDELGQESNAVEDALIAGRVSTVRYIVDNGHLTSDAVPELILSDTLRHNTPCHPELWKLLVDIIEGVVGDRKFQYISFDLVLTSIKHYDAHIAVFLVSRTSLNSTQACFSELTLLSFFFLSRIPRKWSPRHEAAITSGPTLPLRHPTFRQSLEDSVVSHNCV
jgi:hypothetical protein